MQVAFQGRTLTPEQLFHAYRRFHRDQPVRAIRRVIRTTWRDKVHKLSSFQNVRVRAMRRALEQRWTQEIREGREKQVIAELAALAIVT